MNNNTDIDKLINKAAVDVLMLARNTLIVNLRFMDAALSRLEFVPDDNATLATDGVRLTYGPKHVLRCFRSDHDKPARDYLHVILHCIFSHMFIETLVDRELWDLACDITVESTIDDLGIHMTDAVKQNARKAEIERLRAEVRTLTAEKIYHYYRDHAPTEYELERLSELFRADDHTGWYRPERSGTEESGDDESHNNSETGDIQEAEDQDVQDAQDENDVDESEYEGDPAYIKPDPDLDWDVEEVSSSSGRYSPELIEEWKNIAEKIQEDLETFSRDQGDAAGGMMQNLNAVNREKYDYTTFLKKFSVLGESMAINDDEFDYIFYTYGLSLYKNMPLVEPLEYKEVKRIKEFVIAIDTSGSTSGELVQRFLEKTYNIMKSSESYFSRINVHIIQCDAVIQEHVKITSDEDFERYISSMSIHGLGGTDFRPVFSFVDQLIEDGEFINLKGLIYFTDGWGEFPVRKPPYDTAFVFLDNEYNNPHVPPWAIKLILQDEEI